jgi:hypothetical protein
MTKREKIGVRIVARTPNFCLNDTDPAGRLKSRVRVGHPTAQTKREFSCDREAGSIPHQGEVAAFAAAIALIAFQASGMDLFHPTIGLR